MKLVELKQAQKTAVTNLKKRRFDLLEFYTFKKDRSVTIKLTENSARLIETGYKELDIELNFREAIKFTFLHQKPRNSQLLTIIRISKYKKTNFQRLKVRFF